MSEYEKFKRESAEEIDALGYDGELADASRAWMERANRAKYSYHFEWMGRPIIQYPQDIVATQEIIWSVKPDLIVETGIAHGGSLIFSASMLELNAISGGPKDAEVLGLDIDIRPHNRAAIKAHPMARRISMIEGSSVAPDVVAKVRAKAAGKSNVLVLLDSNHTHDHVLAELRLTRSSRRSEAIVWFLIRQSRTCRPTRSPTGLGARATTRRLPYGNSLNVTPNLRSTRASSISC